MKTLAFILISAIPGSLFAQNGFTIEGKIGKLNSPAKAFISYRVGDTNISDSAALKNGVFILKGQTNYPVKAYLTLKHEDLVPGRAIAMNGDRLTIFLEKGTIHINSADSIQNATVIAGPVNKDYRQLQSKLKPLSDQRTTLYAGHAAVSAEVRNSESYKAEFQKKSQMITTAEKAIYAVWIGEHPKSVVSLDALQSFGGAVPEASLIEPLYASLSPEIKESIPGKLYAEKIATLKKIAIGAAAPPFSQNDPDGKPVSLSDFRGKYVLIDFWASWCGPCRAENPYVVKAYNKYKGENFTILGVSLDNEKGRDAWLKAIKDDNLTWNHVSDLKYWQNEVAKLYAVNAVPQNFLVDPSGKIIAKNLRGEELTKKLTELFPKVL